MCLAFSNLHRCVKICCCQVASPEIGRMRFKWSLMGAWQARKRQQSSDGFRQPWHCFSIPTATLQRSTETDIWVRHFSETCGVLQKMALFVAGSWCKWEARLAWSSRTSTWNLSRETSEPGPTIFSGNDTSNSIRPLPKCDTLT